MVNDSPGARVRISGARFSVGPVTKLAYGVGALTDSIKTFAFITFLLFYYTTVLGLPGRMLGLAMSVGLVFDAVIDPLIGHISDRLAPSFGRRHSFMLVGAVSAGISFIAVFNPPGGLSTGLLFAWLMVSSLCLRSSCSLFMVPYYALGAELATDSHERTTISGYRAGMVLAGTLLATGVAFVVFLPQDVVTGVDAKFTAGSYEDMGVAFGVAMVIAGLTATLGTLHTRPHLPTSSAVSGNRVAIWTSVAETFRNRSFRILLLCSSWSVMGAAINGALAMHFLTYHARIAAGQAFTFYFGAFYAGALVGVLVWVRVARTVEKHHLLAATTIITSLIVSAGYWLVGEGRPLGTGNVWIPAIGNGLAGFFGIAGGVILPSMMADVTAHDEAAAGRRRDGIFFGVYSFSQQLSSGVAVLIAAGLVEGFAGLVPAQVTQSAATSERLAMVACLIPAAILAGAGFAALLYRRPEPALLYAELAVSAERPQAPA